MHTVRSATTGGKTFWEVVNSSGVVVYQRFSEEAARKICAELNKIAGGAK